jgi:hypothetical protein
LAEHLAFLPSLAREAGAKIVFLMTVAALTRALLMEAVMFWIVALMAILIKPRKPPAPQHPIPSKDPVLHRIVAGDQDGYSS